MTLTELAKLIGEISVLAGAIAVVATFIKKLVRGQKCQLRNDMLAIYYKHKDSKTIPQFEYQNFMEMHDAYKALKGNSFVDKIHNDITGWEISSEDDD